jgi:hypothetical protein
MVKNQEKGLADGGSIEIHAKIIPLWIKIQWVIIHNESLQCRLMRF